MLVDCGVNLTAAALRDDIDQLMHNAANSGVKRMVLIGTSESTSADAARLAALWPHCVATAGVHPHDAAHVSADYLNRLRELAAQPQVRAIGECGLDYNRNYSPPAVQRSVFAAQLELAVDLQLPVYLHERDALTDQLHILDEYISALPAAFTHCFTGDRSTLEAYLERGCYIGITGWVCDERRGAALQEAVPFVPDDRLLLETDAPYLLPRTIKPKPKSRTNTPANLPYVLHEVARLREQTSAYVARTSSDNAIRLFGAWPELSQEENHDE
ncbi:hydrolase TatD [Aliidiomarina halalkaliphila]|uniref:Hydrolase TatD n=1 Tax=Aliidiomarina halalkaliphila TaxID=2593535 RepID=A0A552X075_9GAMM|nr:TatD family hydrolase [Aliidiomarina halalkaliphila]TRW48461.1 hydrolase TatD [Aliidiomarina halalkaliphila]